jgi:hypothetical protein
MPALTVALFFTGTRAGRMRSCRSRARPIPRSVRSAYRPLTPGMGPNVEPLIPPAIPSGVSKVLIASAAMVGASRLPPPDTARNLMVAR